MLDTQANGTAVEYDSERSMTAEYQKGLHGRVALPSCQNQGYIEGGVIFDEIAFDHDEQVYVDDFMFLSAEFIKYKELESSILKEEFNGVINFNRFGFDRKQGLGQTLGIQGKANVIRAMIDDAALTNYTI